ncbi:MAG: TonB-dependent receptor [Cryomorphaceae bacterium]|nr:TonB-dependent receptor [Cryomorphaceae bacterium]
MKTRPHWVLAGLFFGAWSGYAQSADSTLQLSTVPVWSQAPAANVSVQQASAHALWASGADIRMTSPGSSLLLSRDGYPSAYVQGSWEGLPFLTPDLGVADFSLMPQWGQQTQWGSTMASQYQSGQALGELLDIRGQKVDVLELKGSSLKQAGIGGIWTIPGSSQSEMRVGGGTEAWKNDYRYGAEGLRRQGADGSRHELFMTHKRNYTGGRWSRGGTGYVVSADRGLPKLYEIDLPERQQDLRAQISQYQSYSFDNLQFRTEQVIWSQNQTYDGPWYSDTNNSQGAYMRVYTGTHWKKWKFLSEETLGFNRMNGVFKPDVTIDYVTLHVMVESPMTKAGKFTLGGKWATWDTKKSPLSPHLAWEKKGATWSLEGHVRQMFRFPTMNDLFWTGFGNPDLHPEHGWEVQFGGMKTFSKLHLSGSVFRTDLKDAIVWMPDAFDNWRPVNQSSWNRQGAKFSGSFNGWEKWSMNGHIRYAHVTNEDGNRAPYVAPWLGNASAIYRMLKGALSASWTGQSAAPLYWVTYGPTYFLPAQSSVGIQYAHQIAGGVEAEIRIENLFNQKLIFQEGYPMPGRHLLTTLRYKL